MANIKIYNDFARIAQISSDFHRRIIAGIVAKPKLLGKLNYAFLHPQAARWKKDPVPLKMTTMYLTAEDLLIEAGVPKELLKIAIDGLGNVAGKPPTFELRESVKFISAAWHSRAARVYKLLLEEFKNGKYVVSYGSGSGVIEILALIASGNKKAKVDLMDKDHIGIEAAESLIELFCKHGYDIRNQTTTSVDDIFTIELPNEADTVASIGLLHNYFPLETANKLVQKWFNSGAKKLITDIYYDPAQSDNGNNDAKLRAKFVNRVLNWKFGSPDGLLFCNNETFCKSLSDYTIDVYA
jgi:hypothetical protein